VPLHVERRGRVAVLTLDDPGRRNALTLPLVADLAHAVDACEMDESVGAVVVTGAPPAFCAGADLGDLAATGDGDGGEGEGDARAEASLREIYEGFLRLARCTLPTVAAVNGPAVGAGLNLALACDVRLAGESARFESRFLDLGLHPGGGHTWLLHRIGGPQAAAAMVLFGERLDGRRAAEVGLAWRAFADDELLDAAVALAERAAEAPERLSLRAKESLRAASGFATHDEAVDAELVHQLWSVTQPEFRERLAAIAQRVSSKRSTTD